MKSFLMGLKIGGVGELGEPNHKSKYEELFSVFCVNFSFVIFVFCFLFFFVFWFFCFRWDGGGVDALLVKF